MEEINYKHLTVDDMISYCKAHGEVQWLKAAAARTKETKVYPKIKVDGKWVTDKTAEPTIETVPISFVELKRDFLEKFMPDKAPKKKAAGFRDKILAL